MDNKNKITTTKKHIKKIINAIKNFYEMLYLKSNYENLSRNKISHTFFKIFRYTALLKWKKKCSGIEGKKEEEEEEERKALEILE